MRTLLHKRPAPLAWLLLLSGAVAAVWTGAAQAQGGYRIRATVVEAQPKMGRVANPLALHFNIANKRQGPERVPLNQPTGWVDLTPWIAGTKIVQVPRINVAGTPLSSLTMRIETQSPSGARSYTETVQGNTVVLAVAPPGYQGEGPQGIEPMSQYAKRYLEAARRAAPRNMQRPRQFVASIGNLIGGHGSVEQLETFAELAGVMGFNTAALASWDQIPPQTIDQVLDRHGITKRAQGVYMPPSHFYWHEKMDSAALEKWAADLKTRALNSTGGTAADIALLKIADEPGWHHPNTLQELRNSPSGLRAFRAYLQEQGLRPSEVGGSSWEQVMPVGAGSARDLPSRRLYHWTMRFFADSAVRGHKMGAEAAARAFGRPVPAAVNWNNWVNNWYRPSPNKKTGNISQVGPDSGSGFPEWFTAGRLNAHTLWTEDWFEDEQSQNWSLYADALRSSAAMGSQEFGGYMVSRLIGDHPEGASYRLLSLVGHGAKIFEFYTFGPLPLFPGNGWSDRWEAYGPIARAMHRVGSAERVLYPGRMERGKVALLASGVSRLWDDEPRQPLYSFEIWPLHYALVHAGYTVDLVDDVDLAGDALRSRGYTALYVTQPNVSAAAQQGIREWVRGGGTVVVTNGGAVTDEYNTPTTTMDEVLGVGRRKDERGLRSGIAPRTPVTDEVTLADAQFGSGAVGVHGPVQPLRTTTASAAGRFRSGGAAVAVNRFGSGRAVTYGFFPGWQYWNSASRAGKGIPTGWDDDKRRLVTAPARLANTPRPVTSSREGVEITRLQSSAGIALVVLNWTDEPISNLTVTVPRAGRFTRVSSVERGSLNPQVSGDTVRITLPVKNVDVLMLE